MFAEYSEYVHWLVHTMHTVLLYVQYILLIVTLSTSTDGKYVHTVPLIMNTGLCILQGKLDCIWLCTVFDELRIVESEQHSVGYVHTYVCA